MPVLDSTIIGKRFGRLVVLSLVGRTRHRHTTWMCRCDCGQSVTLSRTSFKSQQSCGCLRREATSMMAVRYHRTHGQTKTREFVAWPSAKSRCTSPTNKNFNNYGGRGITMCDEWLHDFPAFWAHIGPCPSGLTLDRIDNDGHYEPGNVRWATHAQQAANRRKARRAA